MPMNIYENNRWKIILRPLAKIYGFIIRIREKLYAKNIFRTYKLDCQVICVGNITVGGTGKTPVVEFLAQFLTRKRRLKVGVLSRGYKRSSSGTVIVTDGLQIQADSRQAGDEPYLLAKNLKNVPIVVDENRVRGGRILLKKFGIDLILLDDGFQHHRLQKDLNIVVINARNGFGNNELLPAGPLREPLDALYRAELLWIHQPLSLRWPELRNLLRSYRHARRVYSDYSPTHLVEIPSEKEAPLERLKNKRVLAFAGIANPARFRETLETLDCKEIRLISFPDHHFYTPKSMKKISAELRAFQPDLLVTTEKDFVRLSPEFQIAIPFYYLKLEIKVIQGLEWIRNFETLIQN